MPREIRFNLPEFHLRVVAGQSRSLGISLIAAIVLGLSFQLSGPPLPFPVCLFRVFTSLPCPSCGMTHAFIALGHGRPVEAFLANIMSPFLFLALIAIMGVSVFESVTGRFFLQPFWARVKNKVLVVVLVQAAFSWAWNLYKHFSHSAF
jgi:hypothetical protein